jgi:shikimate dehydrogenase
MHWQEVRAKEGVDIRVAAVASGADLSYLQIVTACGLSGLGMTHQIELLDIERTDFDKCIAHLRNIGFRGAFVANPFKVDAARVAERFWIHRFALGVANSLFFENGIFAQNTEVPAIAACIKDVAKGPALVMGTGHAARSVIAGLLTAGFDIRLWNRNVNKTRILKSLLERHGNIELMTSPDPSGCKLIVNATPLGSKLGEQPPVIWARVLPKTVCFDLVFRRVPTDFLRTASLRGLKTIDGRELLVEQCAEVLQWWTGKEPSRDAMRAAVGVKRLPTNI